MAEKIIKALRCINIFILRVSLAFRMLIFGELLALMTNGTTAMHQLNLPVLTTPLQLIASWAKNRILVFER